ncbi:hypothetical protein C0431_15145 [bacterium]|nr:hypothetical protein [bacterium]
MSNFPRKPTNTTVTQEIYWEFHIPNHNIAAVIEDDGTSCFCTFYRINQQIEIEDLIKVVWLYNVIPATNHPSQSPKSCAIIAPNIPPINPDHRLQSKEHLTFITVYSDYHNVDQVVFAYKDKFLSCALSDKHETYSPEGHNSMYIKPLTSQIASQFDPNLIQALRSKGVNIPSQFH